jgi:hypothetical protein
VDLAGGDLEIEPVEGADVAERLDQSGDGDDRGHAATLQSIQKLVNGLEPLNSIACPA